MSKHTEKSEISAYLMQVKKLISVGKYDFVPRRKNLQSLAQYGLTVTDAKNEILDLTAKDYYAGPKSDKDPERPGDIWEFKKEIDGIQFYIKVKIVLVDGDYVLRCLGFHESDFPS